MHLQIAYSTDNNYAQHVGVSMVSLFENNQEFTDITVYILTNNVSLMNRENLLTIAHAYKRKIIFIEMAPFLNNLPLHISDSIAISAYSRLFLASALPKEVEKIIYMDCDTVINGSLAELWTLDLDNCFIAGVADSVSQYSENYSEIGLSEEDHYINSGVIVIDLNIWRSNHIEQNFIDFILHRGGNVRHHDQGTINGVLRNKCKIIHPKYNVMSVFFTMSREQIIKYYNMKSYCYSSEMLAEAIRKPVIIHYTPGFVGRPWVEGCKHPLQGLYLGYLKKTPWKDTPLFKNRMRFREKAIAFLYTNMPFDLAHSLCNGLIHIYRGLYEKKDIYLHAFVGHRRG